LQHLEVVLGGVAVGAEYWHDVAVDGARSVMVGELSSDVVPVMEIDESPS